jgi:hypothetical protein
MTNLWTKLVLPRTLAAAGGHGVSIVVTLTLHSRLVTAAISACRVRRRATLRRRSVDTAFEYWQIAIFITILTADTYAMMPMLLNIGGTHFRRYCNTFQWSLSNSIKPTISSSTRVRLVFIRSLTLELSN